MRPTSISKLLDNWPNSMRPFKPTLINSMTSPHCLMRFISAWKLARLKPMVLDLPG